MIHRLILAVSLLSCACTAPPRAAPTENDIIGLEAAAIAGEPEAIRALFGVRNCALDGATAEGADMVLGTCARLSPQVFLEELVRNGRVWGGLGYVLCNAGSERTDDSAAQADELEARRAALMTVTTPALCEARDACVAVLSEEIEKRHAEVRQEAAADARDQAGDRR